MGQTAHAFRAAAGVDPVLKCKDAKGKAAGLKGLALMKAFGKNMKTPNDERLASDISKAQSNFTKLFTKAEQKVECGIAAGGVEPEVDGCVDDLLSLVIEGTTRCGNGELDGDEQCDPPDYGGATCETVCRDRSRCCPKTDRYPIPAEKSLFGTGNQHGLPIGNLTSQFWANAYLNEVDQLVKRRLRCRYYVRYVDDLVLLSEQPAGLIRWRGEIEEFLQARLRLGLRAGGQEPVAVGHGIDFVGWNACWTTRMARSGTR